MQQTQSAPKPGAARRNAFKAAVFTLLVALLLFTASEVLRDKDTTLSGIYSEPKDTVDAFFVGSSHVNSAIIPGVLWREFGISAFNVYSWSQSPWVAFHHIQEALKTQHPKVLVLDLYGMMYGHPPKCPKPSTISLIKAASPSTLASIVWRCCGHKANTASAAGRWKKI